MQNGFLSITCMIFSFLWSGKSTEQAIVRIIWGEGLGAEKVVVQSSNKYLLNVYHTTGKGRGLCEPDQPL